VYGLYRKITEIFRAIELEQEYYTKEQILEAYLNIMPLTGNIVGVGAGATTIRQGSRTVSWSECAVLGERTTVPYRTTYRNRNVRTP